MHLALSSASNQALWILMDSEGQLVDSRSSIVDDQSLMSTQLGTLLDDLLLSNSLSLNKIHNLGVVVGPGAFTGLRMGVSFSEGLCLAQEIKKIPISSFNLVGKVYVMPLRHTKAPLMTPQDYVTEGFESLLIKSPTEFEAILNIPVGVAHRGFLNSHPWPSSEELAKAFRESPKNPVEKFEITYGLTPKIFGVRS